MKLSNTRTAYYASLQQARHRRKEGLFLICGQKCVQDTAHAFQVEALIRNSLAGGHIDIGCREQFSASPAQMSRISRMDSPPAVIAVCRLPEWEEEPGEVRNLLSLVLDDVQDPGNLGTIVRAADWFGVRYVFASPGTADVFSPKAVQASMGALAHVRVIYRDLGPLFDTYGDLPVYGTLLEGNDIYRSQLSDRGFIVMGNEGRGISEELRRRLTSALHIPSYPEGHNACESLNVGMATSIVLAEFRRRQLTGI